MKKFKKGKEGPQSSTAEKLLEKLNSAGGKEETFRQLVLECLGILCDCYGQMVSTMEQSSKNTELIVKALEDLTDIARNNLAYLKMTRERGLCSPKFIRY